MKYRYNEIYADAGERSRYETLTRRLCELGHKPGEVRYFTAPGRTELCGNHTDHQHGLVLAGSVDVDTIAAVAENGSGKLLFFSEGFPSAVLSLDPRENEAAPGSAAALVAGMIAMFADKAPLRGLDVCLSSTVLPGSGLSSSASVEVLLGEIFNEWYGLGLTAVELARLGQRVENEFFGKPCGLLDQAACAVGGVSWMDFRDSDAPVVEKLELDPEQYGYALFLVSCGADHADLTDEYAAIPAELKRISAVFGTDNLRAVDEDAFYDRLSELRTVCGDRAVLRAMHVFDENRRVFQMREAVSSGDFARFLDLVRASGLSSWRLLQNIAPRGSLTQPMALTLAVMEKVLGGDGACRVHGGGFAGTAQAFVPLDAADRFAAEVERLLPAASCQRRRLRAVGAAEVAL